MYNIIYISGDIKNLCKWKPCNFLPLNFHHENAHIIHMYHIWHTATSTIATFIHISVISQTKGIYIYIYIRLFRSTFSKSFGKSPRKIQSAASLGRSLYSNCKHFIFKRQGFCIKMHLRPFLLGKIARHYRQCVGRDSKMHHAFYPFVWLPYFKYVPLHSTYLETLYFLHSCVRKYLLSFELKIKYYSESITSMLLETIKQYILYFEDEAIIKFFQLF